MAMEALVIFSLFFFFIIFLSLIAINTKPIFFFFFHCYSNSQKKHTSKPLQLPPSPPSLPFLGHLHLVKKPLHRTLQSLTNHHGPILHLRFGSRPVLLISSPSAVEQCFIKNDVIFANRPQLLAAKHLNYNFTTLVSASYGPNWRNLRRFTLLEVFSATRLHISASFRREEVLDLVKSLVLMQSGCDHRGENIDSFKVELKSKFNELVFNTTTKMMGMKRYYGDGVRLEDLEEAKMFREIMRESLELIGSPYVGDYVKWLRWVDLKGLEKRMVRLQKRRDEFLKGVVEERRRMKTSRRNNGEILMASSSSSSIAAGSDNTTIDVLLTLQDREPDYYTDEIIYGIIMTLLSTATHTSSMTMEWAMALLLNNPEKLDKAREEIDAKIGTNRLLQESDLPKLPYLQNIINETLRLFPPTAIIVPHESSEECVVGGFRVPRGTMLLVNAWAIHRDPKVWANPDEFKPERFDEEKEDGNTGFKFRFIPFGFGRRGCPGTRMAMRMVGLTLGSLIQCFEWRRVNGDRDGIDMSEGPGVTIPKVKPLEALYSPRESMRNVIASSI